MSKKDNNLKKHNLARSNVNKVKINSGDTQKKLNNFFARVDMEKTKTITNISISIISILTSIRIILNAIYQFMHKNDCEEFYNIPGKYFEESIDNSLIRFFLIILLVVIIVLYPIIMKKLNHDNKKIFLIFAIGFSIIMGMVFGLLNIYSVTYIVTFSKKKWLLRLVGLFGGKNFLIIIAIISIITVMLITFNKEIDNRINKKRVLRKIFVGIGSLIIAVTFIIIIIGQGLWFFSSVSDKTKYEVIIKDEKNYVIISNLDDDRMLIVPYELDENKYIFDTKEYEIVNCSDFVYSYINMKYPPQIKENTSVVDDLNNENAEN